MSLVPLLLDAGFVLVLLLWASCDLALTRAVVNRNFRLAPRENSARDSGEVLLSRNQQGSKRAEDNPYAESIGRSRDAGKIICHGKGATHDLIWQIVQEPLTLPRGGEMGFSR